MNSHIFSLWPSQPCKLIRTQQTGLGSRAKHPAKPCQILDLEKDKGSPSSVLYPLHVLWILKNHGKLQRTTNHYLVLIIPTRFSICTGGELWAAFKLCGEQRLVCCVVLLNRNIQLLPLPPPGKILAGNSLAVVHYTLWEGQRGLAAAEALVVQEVVPCFCPPSHQFPLTLPSPPR